VHQITYINFFARAQIFHSRANFNNTTGLMAISSPVSYLTQKNWISLSEAVISSKVVINVVECYLK